MKLSLIITTYNRSEYFFRVLTSVANQRRLPNEILIADDGSGEKTVAVIRNFIESLSVPVIHIRQKDKGFRAAAIRNKAILASSGDYITLLDGDCVVEPNFISDHIRMAEHGCFVQGKRMLVTKDLSRDFSLSHIISGWQRLGKLLFAKQISNRHHLIRFPGFFASRNQRFKGLRSCNMGFFRKDIFSVNGFNEDFTGWGREDSELGARFFASGLLKKTHPFMAVCYHLWHQPLDRSRLSINEGLLKKTIQENERFCINGLVKKV